jgi:hypothetical protein
MHQFHKVLQHFDAQQVKNEECTPSVPNYKSL